MDIRKVLLVDDDSDVRRIGELSLTRVGRFDTVCAASGADALELAVEHQPDVILLDMMMPGLDGLGTFELMLADERIAEIPVVFMTAKVQQSEVEQYLAAGAAGVIPKPFDPVRLPVELQQLVGQRLEARASRVRAV